ncbi:hypothetical protein [Escherichia coli ISC7]|uniref:Uncharacterized protein n=1 Tax=Escherichia coli ISC7 TaxID=1432555 RepID=W1EXE2_ECOLX|nr:hypothetical protein [Escherichia coli ISC7]
MLTPSADLSSFFCLNDNATQSFFNPFHSNSKSQKVQALRY